jgi:hypothetical protein
VCMYVGDDGGEGGGEDGGEGGGEGLEWVRIKREGERVAWHDTVRKVGVEVESKGA